MMSSPVLFMKSLPHAAGLPLPSYATVAASGMDLIAAIPRDKPVILSPFARAVIVTGLLIELPDNYEGQLRPRSGLALQHGITMLNAPGTIDADYRGEVKVLLINLGSETFIVERGMRIAQLVIVPVVQVQLDIVDLLSETTRGDGGFGSTGLLASGSD